MSNDLTPQPAQDLVFPSSPDGGLEAATARAIDFQHAALAPSTVRTYRAGWTQFTGWCAATNTESLPATPATVAAFFAAMAERGQKPGTIGVWAAAINRVHTAAGHPPPMVAGNDAATTLAGIRRTVGVRPRRVQPLGMEPLQVLLGAMRFDLWPDGVKAYRDAAILLAGFAGAMRRSELVALAIGTVEPRPDGSAHVLVTRSKTDQTGEGITKYLPRGEHPELCPTCAVWRWVRLVRLADSGKPRSAVMAAMATTSRGVHVCQDPWVMGQWSADDESALFRPVHKTGQIVTRPAADAVPDDPVRRSRFRRSGPVEAMSGDAVNQMVKTRAMAAGLNPALFGGHSLRAGFVTDALTAGADVLAVRKQTGHKSDSSVAVYDRDHTPQRNNAVTRLGF